MNLQDYKKWAEWDYHMEHPDSTHFPWYFKIAAVFGAIVLWILCKTVETRDWLIKCDPIEVLVALWALVCAGLFLAGIIIAIVL